MRIAIILGALGGIAWVFWKHVITPPGETIHVAGEGGVVEFTIPPDAPTFADRGIPLYGTPEEREGARAGYDSFDRGIKELYATGEFS